MKEKRKEPKEDKKKFYLIKSYIFFTDQPSLNFIQIHYESKYPKEDWESAKSSTNWLKRWRSWQNQRTEKNENKYQLWLYSKVLI